jgi:hypothetical protein
VQPTRGPTQGDAFVHPVNDTGADATNRRHDAGGSMKLSDA